MKIKKTLEGLGAFVLAIVLVAAAMSGLDYVLNDDVDAYTRVMMHDLYEQDKIDSVFVGTSHIYWGINPSITDEAWNENTFSCASASQNIDGAYALLKEAYKSGHVKKCYLELSAKKVCQDKEDWQESTTATYIISDYMKPSLDKAAYILKAVEPKDYVNAFSRTRRNWRTIYSPEAMRDIVSRKSSKEYKTYHDLQNDVLRYKLKGFRFSTVRFKGIMVGGELKITENYVSQDFQDYLAKIADYCRDNEIELVCFAAPMSEYMMEQTENYDLFDAQAKEICKGLGVPFYNFNLADPAVLDLTDQDFKDQSHLNSFGADKFTKVFADFFAGKIKEEDLFYDSYSEKKKHLPEKFIGLNLKRDESKEICKITTFSTEEEAYRYEVSFTDGGGSEVLLQEKSSNTDIKMPTKDKIKLTITVYNEKGKKVKTLKCSV